MAPWAPSRERPHYVWVPEGSYFPPSYLKRCLRELHGPIDKCLPFSPVDSRLAVSSKPIERPESPSRSFPLRRCASHITRSTRAATDCTPAYIPITFPPARIRGKPRRWSLSVPPSYISTEFITRRLESQRINTITGCDYAQSDAAVVDAPSLPLPAIKVSTSTTTIAISFPGSPERPTPTPEPLAVRRGQKRLAPLTLDSPRRANEEYPGIPTAFLGTPSAYSPNFRLTSSIARIDADSPPISDMINTLRSQASSLKVSTPVELEASLPLLDISPSSANSLSAASSDIVPSVSEDDWAFAQDLMSRYGDQAQDKTSGQAKHRQQQTPSKRKSLTPKARSAVQTNRVRRASVPQAASTPRNRPKSSSAPRTDLAKPRYNSRQLKGSRQTTPNGGIMNYVPHLDSSPSSPLFGSPSPTTPSHTETLAFDSPTNSRSEFSTKRPPGILKHAKSVRFADMPKRGDARDNTPSTNQSLTNTPKGTGGTQSLPPSPLRASFVSEESDIQTSSRQPLAIPRTEVSTRVSTVDRRNSVQLAPQTVNSRSSMFNSRASSATPALSDKCAPSGNSRTVKPLSLLAKEQDKEKEKENSPLALRTPRRARRNTEVDENAARRASATSRSESGSRKHRLSSPLKSFLERLRA